MRHEVSRLTADGDYDRFEVISFGARHVIRKIICVKPDFDPLIKNEQQYQVAKAKAEAERELSFLNAGRISKVDRE